MPDRRLASPAWRRLRTLCADLDWRPLGQGRLRASKHLEADAFPGCPHTELPFASIFLDRDDPSEDLLRRGAAMAGFAVRGFHRMSSVPVELASRHALRCARSAPSPDPDIALPSARQVNHEPCRESRDELGHLGAVLAPKSDARRAASDWVRGQFPLFRAGAPARQIRADPPHHGSAGWRSIAEHLRPSHLSRLTVAPALAHDRVILLPFLPKAARSD